MFPNRWYLQAQVWNSPNMSFRKDIKLPALLTSTGLIQKCLIQWMLEIYTFLWQHNKNYRRAFLTIPIRLGSTGAIPSLTCFEPDSFCCTQQFIFTSVIFSSRFFRSQLLNFLLYPRRFPIYSYATQFLFLTLILRDFAGNWISFKVANKWSFCFLPFHSSLSRFSTFLPDPELLNPFLCLWKAWDVVSLDCIPKQLLHPPETAVYLCPTCKSTHCLFQLILADLMFQVHGLMVLCLIPNCQLLLLGSVAQTSRDSCTPQRSLWSCECMCTTSALHSISSTMWM